MDNSYCGWVCGDEPAFKGAAQFSHMHARGAEIFREAILHDIPLPPNRVRCTYYITTAGEYANTTPDQRAIIAEKIKHTIEIKCNNIEISTADKIMQLIPPGMWVVIDRYFDMSIRPPVINRVVVDVKPDEDE